MNIGDLNRIYLYLGREKKSPVIEYQYVLDIPVTEECLEKAVSETVKRFPFFGLKPGIDTGGFLVMNKNENKMPVFINYEKTLYLGSSETNGYLWCVTTSEQTIRICASHAIADGRGVLFFANLVIYNYLKFSGIDMTGSKLPYSEEDERKGDVKELLPEVCGRINAVADKNLERPENVFEIPEPLSYLDTPFSKHVRITWENESYKNAIHKLGVTPASFMTALVSEAIQNVYNTEGKTVVADVPVDMRPILGSIAQSNFSSNVLLPYKEAYKRMSMEEKCVAFTNSLKMQMTKDNLAAGMNAITPGLAMLSKYPITDKDALKKLSGGEEDSARRTYLMSNIGMVRFPEKMDAHILSFSLKAPNLDAVPAYGLITYRGKGTLGITQNYEDTRIPEIVSERLREYGVKNELIIEGLRESHLVNTALFERMQG